MLSKSESDSAFIRIFSHNLPDLKNLYTLIQRSCPQANLQADIFTYGGKSLVIAYPQPPKAICRRAPTLRLKR